jgi:dephospho-CoA kinase
LYSELGIPSIDTDALYHEMTAMRCALTGALAARFGEDVLHESGALCGPRLAKKVFAPGAEDALADLNRIAHAHILAGARVWLAECRERGLPAALVDAPLLFESGFDKECDSILCVSAGKDVRVERIIRRDGITKERALMRIAAQKDDSELERLSDFVIENNGDLTTLKAQVGDFISKISN